MNIPPPLPKKETCGKAIASLVLGLIGIFIVPLVFAAIVLGHIARGECKKNPNLGGKNMALTGMIIGYVYIGIIAACILMILFGPSPFEAKHVDDNLSGSIKWMPVQGITEEDINDIVFDGSLFIAVADGGLILTSPDGVSWTLTRLDTHDDIDAVAAGNGTRIAVSGQTTYLYDGECWIEQEERLMDRIRELIWTGEQFVGAIDEGVLLSKDGKQWEKVVIPGIDGVPSLKGSDGKIVAERNNIIHMSDTGESWELFKAGNIGCVTPWKGKIWGTSLTNPWIFEYLDNDWKLVLKPKSAAMFSYTDKIIGTESHLFALGDHISWTCDGYTWGSIEKPESFGWLTDVAAGNGRYVLAGTRGAMVVGTGNDDVGNLQKEVARLNQEKTGQPKEPGKGAPLHARIDFYNYPEGFYSRNPIPQKTSLNEVIKAAATEKENSGPVQFDAQTLLKEIMPQLSAKDMDYQTVLDQIRKEDSEVSERYLFISTLEAKELLLSFDAEAGTYPVDYMWLISKLAELAKQQGITITDISMEMGTKKCSKIDEYQLSWRIEGNSYGIHFADDTDWYSPLVIASLNTSMMEQGYLQRFIDLPAGDQVATYIFADPNKVERLVDDYFPWN